MTFNLSHCRTVYCFLNQSYNENKAINQENLMNFVAVALVSGIVLSHPFNKSLLLIALNCILFCLNNRDRQETNFCDQNSPYEKAKFRFPKIFQEDDVMF